ncbi:MAG: hypothetical protein RRB13_13740 [bacterium]|nr:hypothetical protein [bacterium]
MIAFKSTVLVGALVFALTLSSCKKEDADVAQASASGPVVSDGTITTSSVTGNKATISWTKATDADTATTELTYQAYYSTADNLNTLDDVTTNGTSVADATADIDTLTATGLSKATAYYFNVIVADPSGSRALYVPATATTSAIDDTTHTISSFDFLQSNNAGLTSNAVGTISGTDIGVALPFTTDFSSLIPTFAYSGASIMVGTTAQVSGTTANNFSSDVTYQVAALDGSTQDYKVTTIASTGFSGGVYSGGNLSLNAVVTTFAGTAGTAGTDNGYRTNATFNRPKGLTSDGQNFYISDSAGHVIRKLDGKSGQVTTLAGSGTAGSADGIGTAAQFNSPAGLASDGSNLYVADYNSNLIRKISISTGEVTTIAGGGANYNDVGTAANIPLPNDLIYLNGTLYIASYGAHMISKLDLSTNTVSVFAGTPGTSGATNSSTDPLAASFYAPTGITTDGNNLYVAEFNGNKIRSISLSSPYAVSTLAGTGADNATDSTDGTGATAGFSYPYAITCDGTYAYVTSIGGLGGSTVRTVNTSTGNTVTLAGTAGTVGSTDGTGTAALFNGPEAILATAYGLLVGDASGHAIRLIQ